MGSGLRYGFLIGVGVLAWLFINNMFLNTVGTAAKTGDMQTASVAGDPTENHIFDKVNNMLRDVKARLDQLEKEREAFVGSIAYFAANEVPAEGWLVADGSCRNIDEYFALFEKIGDVFSKLNGVSCSEEGQFRLPDLRGVFVRGVDGGRGVDPDGHTRRFGSMQEDSFERHTHTFRWGVWHASNEGHPIGHLYYMNTHKSETSPAGNASETRPVNISLLPCIKY